MDLSHLTDEQVTLALRDIVKDEDLSRFIL